MAHFFADFLFMSPIRPNKFHFTPFGFSWRSTRTRTRPKGDSLVTLQPSHRNVLNVLIAKFQM